MKPLKQLGSIRGIPGRLLRHIGLEENILFPTIQWAQQEQADSVLVPPLGSSFARLRLEHGALATLLMPTPAILAIG